MKIVIIGADGQLGSDLVKTLAGDEIVRLYYPEFDITQTFNTQKTLARLKPETVINTAAYHRVDECEDNPQESFLVNTIAVRDLAQACKVLGCTLVHFSTDYVFDGLKRKPYGEEDVPNPLNVYAVSKLAGEYFVRTTLEKYFLIRSCGLYGKAGPREKGPNFVDAMISLAEKGVPIKVVNDQWVTPTSTVELAEKVSWLIRTAHFGLYHLTNEGECTWHEFAQEIFRLSRKSPELHPVDSVTYGAKARRPSYSVLDNKKARDVGLPPFSHWKAALKRYMENKGYIQTGK